VVAEIVITMASSEIVNGRETLTGILLRSYMEAVTARAPRDGREVPRVYKRVFEGRRIS